MRVSPLRHRESRRLTTVLLVEDEKPVQEVLARWLSQSGRSVVACRTFQEAKAYLAFNTPDLLITDIRLQHYNGLQLVVHMGEKRAGGSCLVITGHDDPVLRKEAEQMHARYLVKPFGRDDFLTEIEHLGAAEDTPTA